MVESQVRVHRRHRWSLAIRFHVSQDQVDAISADPGAGVEVSQDMILEVMAPVCIDCGLTQADAPHFKWCEAPEPLD